MIWNRRIDIDKKGGRNTGITPIGVQDKTLECHFIP
jgi:hypothetical protein